MALISVMEALVFSLATFRKCLLKVLVEPAEVLTIGGRVEEDALVEAFHDEFPQELVEQLRISSRRLHVFR